MYCFKWMTLKESVYCPDYIVLSEEMPTGKSYRLLESYVGKGVCKVFISLRHILIRGLYLFGMARNVSKFQKKITSHANGTIKSQKVLANKLCLETKDVHVTKALPKINSPICPRSSNGPPHINLTDLHAPCTSAEKSGVYFYLI